MASLPRATKDVIYNFASHLLLRYMWIQQSTPLWCGSWGEKHDCNMAKMKSGHLWDITSTYYVLLPLPLHQRQEGGPLCHHKPRLLPLTPTCPWRLSSSATTSRKPPHEADHDFPGSKWYINHFATICIFLCWCLYELLEGWTHLFLAIVSPGANTIPVPNKYLLNYYYYYYLWNSLTRCCFF